MFNGYVKLPNGIAVSQNVLSHAIPDFNLFDHHFPPGKLPKITWDRATLQKWNSIDLMKEEKTTEQIQTLSVW